MSRDTCLFPTFPSSLFSSRRVSRHIFSYSFFPFFFCFAAFSRFKYLRSSSSDEQVKTCCVSVGNGNSSRTKPNQLAHKVEHNSQLTLDMRQFVRSNKKSKSPNCQSSKINTTTFSALPFFLPACPKQKI